MAPAPVTRSCDAHDDVAVADGMTAEARATVEYLAGTVMIGFGIIFLVVGAGSLAARWVRARYPNRIGPGRELNIPGLSPQVDMTLSAIAAIVGVVLIVANV